MTTSPSSVAALEAAYLVSGLVIAVHYVPLLRRAWLHPAATAEAQSLLTWAVWTVCRVIAFAYGWFVLHDVVFLIVVGADLVGRWLMAVLIVRARAWVALRRADAAPGSTSQAGAAVMPELTPELTPEVAAPRTPTTCATHRAPAGR